MSVDPQALPPPILIANPYTVVGPIFIGAMINWMLMGTLIVQVYLFYLSFRGDAIAIQLLAYGLFCIDLTQTGISTHLAWYYAIASWNNPPALVGPSPWSVAVIPVVDGLTAAIVQTFYAWRIWALRRTKIMRGLAVLIVLLALLQGFAAIVTSGLIMRDSALQQQNLVRYHTEFALWLACGVVTDMLVTGCMLYILCDARVHTPWAQSKTLINRLITNTIQSGTVTVVCAAVDLALFVAFVDTNYHFVPAYILGKLYSNSLMATLNARKATRTTPLSSAQSQSFGMRVQVSRETQRTSNEHEPGVHRWSRVKVSHSAVGDHDGKDTWPSEDGEHAGRWALPEIPNLSNLHVVNALSPEDLDGNEDKNLR